MREQLIQYVHLLFAGAPDTEEIRMEILQNTLDRYDDLIEQGKSPEAAYRLAISGIGDINEILNGRQNAVPSAATVFQQPAAEKSDTPLRAILRAVAVGLYILCPIPLIILSTLGSDFMDIVGLCGTLAIVAVATVIMILCRKREPDEENHRDEEHSPESELHKSIGSVTWAIGLAAYFILSFTTGAWHITWLVFLITGAVEGLIKAIVDLKGGK